MRTRRFVFTMLAAMAAFACERSPTAPPTDSTRPNPPQLGQTGVVDQTGDQRTPFQRSLMQAIAEREAQGLPVPVRVEYEYQAGPAPQPAGVAAMRTGSTPQQRTITARTTIEFDDPEQAGLSRWPDVVVEGEVPPDAEGFVRSGDYTEFIKQQIAQQYPTSNVDYETGPRTYTFAESLLVAEPEQASAPMAVRLENLSTVTIADELLLGFTVLGPNIDYSIGFDVDICVFWFFGCVAEVELIDFWAGFKLDWTIGTRLPMAMSVTSPDPVLEGSSFSPTTAATGTDWEASDFEGVGVSGEEGNEFILQFVFKVGVFLEVLTIDIIDLGIDVDLDRTSSFATPLGPGETFDLPSIDISIWGFDVAVAEADIGVTLTPQAGSDKYTADWLASAEGSGAGSVTYTNSGQPVPLGSVTAVDGPGNAAVELSGFRYYFTQFSLDLGLYFYLSVLGYGGTWNIPITDFDLSALTGGLYVGPHDGTAGTLDLSIPIENVAPSVTLSRSGTVTVNGVPIFLVQGSQTLPFSGEVTDPGRDDLTLTWDWGDGPPSPDLSTFYPVPYTVTENQSHVFDNACVYQVTLTAVDDDLATGTDAVPVVVTASAGGRARLDGYWQHQFGRNGRTDFDDQALQCLLGIVDQMSAVFGEVRNISGIAAAYDILFMQQNGGSLAERLDRELLVMWLNFATGAFDYAAPVDTDGDRVADMPFADAMTVVEATRTDPAATAQALRDAIRTLHQLALTAVGQRTASSGGTP